MEVKQCVKCKETKNLNAFHKSKRHLLGVKNECAACTNAYLRRHYKKNKDAYGSRNQENHYKRKYNISYEDYVNLCKAVNFCCQICQKEYRVAKIGQGRGRMDILVLDHCHVTDSIRGILCQNCNRGLGLFYDDETCLAAAINYLKKQE